MSNKKTYYPSKSFDDDLEGLVKLYRDKGWSFSNVDLTQLEQDSLDQRRERAAHDQMQGQFRNLHERFGVSQESRYERFSTALKAARGAFSQDKATMAELRRFKRSTRRRASSETAKEALDKTK